MVEVFPANLPIFLNEKVPNEYSSRNWKNCKLLHGEKERKRPLALFTVSR